jgi:hypothetical protein
MTLPASIRQNIIVLPADEPTTGIHDQIIITRRNTVGLKILKIGFTISEQVGLAIINPRAVTHGSKSVIIGK